MRRATDDAQRLARQGLRAVIDDLRASGHDVIGCGIVLASGRPATTLAATLASHALIHTAEGELFREVLVQAGERHGLRHLSMGTSQDYVVAAQEGATIVRLGTSLYA